MIEDTIISALEAGDYGSVTALYAPDAILDMNLPRWRFQLQGPTAARGYFDEQFGAFEDPPKITQLRSVRTDTGLVVETEARFRLRGEEALWRAVDLFRIGDDHVTEHVQYCSGCWTADDIRRQAAEAPMIQW